MNLTRAAAGIVEQSLRKRRVTAILGPRQSGKSTLMGMIWGKHPEKFSPTLSLDDPDLRLRLAENPVAELKRWGKKIILLDEVQKLPLLFDVIKLLADEPSGASFLITGSAQLQLLPRVKESLAGRVRLIDLLPMSLAERAGRGDQEIGFAKLWKNTNEDCPSLDLFSVEEERRVRLESRNSQLIGDFPALTHAEHQGHPWEWLRDYRRTYLERDLADIGRPHDLDQFARAQKFFASRVATILDQNAIAQDLGVTVPTVRRWLRFLEISYQAILIEPVGSEKTRMVGRPKLIFGDVGLGRLLAENRNLNDGYWYENWAMLQLIKWMNVQSDPPSLRYLRTSAGLEIDAVIQHGDGKVVLMEIKSALTPRSSWAHSFERAREIIRKPRAPGIVCYRGRKIQKIGERIWAVPDFILFG
ncbi:MAG: ATP-binding protein [Verrucomicrobiota bacterium]